MRRNIGIDLTVEQKRNWMSHMTPGPRSAPGAHWVTGKRYVRTGSPMAPSASREPHDPTEGDRS